MDGVFSAVSTKEIEFSLEPLLKDKKQQASAFRVRKKQHIEKSIHPADLDKYIENGWLLQREGKQKARVKKAKSHDRWLEDRIWCLLYQMGYDQIGGDRFIIRYVRQDESKGKKQIDVFACDGETAFVIECKSREVRGRKTLQKDLHETAYLKEHVRKSIYSHYPDGAKPKIIWAYVTQNIIWSDNDVERAHAEQISIITENEVQYFEAFVRHMGNAGKYQILGEFLNNQKVPGMEEVKVHAICGKIGGEKFYSFVVTPRRLLKIAFINHQALNHPDGRPAYQRMISSSRIKEINKYIQSGGYFPTNILVNFTVKPRFDFLPNGENTDPSIKFGWITLPSMYRSAWIIDGQHRLYGYSGLDDKWLDQSLFVLAFDGMDTKKEADLFVTINHKQKSVPKGLLDSLLADLKLGDSDPKTALSALASAVVRAVNTDKTSPLSRRFSTPGVPAEPQQNLTISEAVNGLNRSELLGRVVKKNRIPGPLSGPTDEDTVVRAKSVINAYFEELRSANSTRWEAGKSAYIAVNPGIRAQLMLIAEIIRYLTHKKDVDFHTLNAEDCAQYIIEFAVPVFDYIGSASDDEIKEKFSRKFGEGGVKEYLYHLFQIIHEEREDFGSDEFLNWMTRQASDKVDEANNFIMQLSELMTNQVIDTLKAVHGTKILDSGDAAFWEIGIESRRVKDNAYKKQQEDNQERRKAKEAYLEIVDLIEIIKQKNNWSHFEAIFNLPMPEEKKGNKYYLKWVGVFNELRKIAAHKNALRTYTDEDLEFLDWLRSEMMPRLLKVN